MAQGTVKKGFFFYFGLFVLLLVAVFLICLVVMMFNPGSTVLWMKYFTSDVTYAVSKTSDGTEFDLGSGSISKVVVNCGYADVSVVASQAYANKDGLYIVNNAKGFQAASGAKAFSCHVTLDEGVLTLDVTEPNGFLYFSKNITVVINNVDNTLKLGNIEIEVNSTGDGDITFGGNSNKHETSVAVKGADIDTESGNIVFHKNFITNSLTTPSSFVTNSGKILAIENDMNFNTSVLLGTASGRMNFDKVNVGTNTLSLKNKKGAIAIGEITASKIDVVCSQGNFKFEKINGDIDFNQSIDTIISPIIEINEITGNFNIFAINSEISVSPDIRISKIDGDLTVLASKGAVVVGEANGAVAIEGINENGKGNLNTNVVIGEANTNSLRFVSETGNVKIGFNGDVSNDVFIKTKSSKIEVNITNKANFKAVAKRYATEDFVEDKNITLSIDSSLVSYPEAQKSDLTVSGTSSFLGDIKLYTDSTIRYNLVEGF